MEEGTLERLEQQFQAFARHEFYEWQYRIILECLRYWELYDGAHHTQHSAYIRELYFCDENDGRGAADRLQLVRRTLYRYRIDYMKIVIQVCRNNDVIV